MKYNDKFNKIDNDDEYEFFDFLVKNAPTVRIYNSLYRAGIQIKKDLISILENNDKTAVLKKIAKFGEKSYNDLIKIIT
jgi:DNA-directed RNA polymerase alpha subunit